MWVVSVFEWVLDDVDFVVDLFVEVVVFVVDEMDVVEDEVVVGY